MEPDSVIEDKTIELMVSHGRPSPSAASRWARRRAVGPMGPALLGGSCGPGPAAAPLLPPPSSFGGPLRKKALKKKEAKKKKANS